MKLLGMLLICSEPISSRVAGSSALSAMKTRGERIRSLRALGRMLELMEGELSSTLCPIPELLSTLEKKSGGAAKRFLSALASRMDRLGTERFSKLWEASLRGSLALDREDLDTLRQLWNILGQYDLDRQLEAIAQCRLRLLQSAEKSAAIPPPLRVSRLSSHVSRPVTAPASVGF